MNLCHRSICLATFLIAGQSAAGISAHAQSGATDTAAPLYSTVAESSGYTATAHDYEVAGQLRQLANQWTESELTTIGRTTEGRPLWALLVHPTEELEYDPLTVLILGGIHSGECDGKEALLALARDMAAGKRGEWWRSLRLIFVPNFNADGNERRGLGHRPGQAGPEQGMGVRENAQGLDLNRDFMKLDSPEVSGLVTALNLYQVDVLIDTHTTNGSLHQYQLTYDIPHNPSAPSGIDAWLRRQLLPRVTRELNGDGISTFYYGNFDSQHRTWTTYGYQPRYSTEYMGMRGKIGILSESYSYASYEKRIEASYRFVEGILRELSSQGEEIREMLNVAASESQPGAPLALRAEITKTADGVVVPGFERPDGGFPRGPYNSESLQTHSKKDYTVQLWNRAAATKETVLPFAYAIPPQYAWAAGRLAKHGIQVVQLSQPTEIAVEAYRLLEVADDTAFQRHTPIVVETEVARRTQLLPAGTMLVPTEQPLGKLAAHLLEPEADDSLAHWNFFDPDIQPGEEFPVLRVVEPVAADLVGELETIPASEQITLDHLYAPGKSVSFGGARIRGARWLKNADEYVISDPRGRTFAVDAETGSRRRLTELDALQRKLAALDAFDRQQAIAAAKISAFTDDWKYALLSHKNDLYFFDADASSIRQLTHTPNELEELPELSPSGDRVAFVRDNNLWVVDTETTELRQLTSDGSTEILNGKLDWVYQEELYGRGNFKGFWWDEQGDKLAYLKLDQTPVPSYQVSDSISFAQTLEATRYPKAGQPIPSVNVLVCDIASSQHVPVDLSGWNSNDRLVGRVSWSPGGQLWLQVFNRVQNQQDLVRVDPNSGASNIVFSEVSPGWIEIRGTPEFLPDGDFLWLSDLPHGRTHLFRVSPDGLKSQLTTGDWDVSDLVSVSSDFSTAFVEGNISAPIDSQLVAVGLETGNVEQITLAPGTHRPAVSASGKYFIDVFSSTVSQPFAAVYRSDGQMLRVIEAPISDRHQYLDVREPQTFTIKARDGLPLQAQLLLPADFDPEKPERKLPVIFYVYGGPQAPTVSNAWEGRNYWWHQMLCQQGFAILLCDNRSARGRGVKDTWTIRGDMCRVELQDLEDAVGWLREQPWADANRIGIWGWSYGGYFTSYALTHSKSFACGIAGAPVTDWRNYDAIYTERYMDLPQANESGYDSSSVVKAASELHGELLIIHGERDDNVHMSNTLQLVHALQEAGKQFDLMVYPKNRHGITQPQQRAHMYRMMTDFFHEHLLAH